MLESIIIQEIEETGPITQGRFMELALTHPTYGYYRTSEAVNRDFTTSPEISQMFGELLGIWVLDLLEKLPEYKQINLVELGPGQGTLMADILRVIKKYEDRFNIIFVEVNPVLKEQQQAKVSQATWVEKIEEIPLRNPLIMIANEFFDSLPTEYFKREEGILYQRFVTVKDGEVTFIYQPLREEAGPTKDWEESPISESIFTTICERLLNQKGAFLNIDYGYESGIGDSLQALYKGSFSNPLTHIGRSDLTCHVNFGKLMKITHKLKVNKFGPLSQGEFLLNLGLDVRLQMLKHMNPDQGELLDSAAKRLVHPYQMGNLFKVMTVFSPSNLEPIGFKKCF